MDPGTAAGIAGSGAFGLYALMKMLKRLLGFKKCKYHSKSDNDECIFGCRATKREKKTKDQGTEPEPELELHEVNL